MIIIIVIIFAYKTANIFLNIFILMQYVRLILNSKKIFALDHKSLKKV